VLSPLDYFFGLFSWTLALTWAHPIPLSMSEAKVSLSMKPSFVAVERRTRAPIEVGRAPKRCGAKIRRHLDHSPTTYGVISEFDITESMLKHLIHKAHEQTWVPIPRPRVVVGIPSGVTEVEKRAVYDAAVSAGSREVHLIENP